MGDLVERIISLVNSYTDSANWTNQLGSESFRTSNIAKDPENDSQFSILNSQLINPERLIHVELLRSTRLRSCWRRIRCFHKVYGMDGVFPDLRDKFEIYYLIHIDHTYHRVISQSCNKKHSDNTRGFC